MSGTRNWNIPWLNHNSERRYPLAMDATAQDTSGGFTLPDSFIVGLILPISTGANLDPAAFFIHTVRLYGSGYTVRVGHSSAAGVRLIASATIPRSTHVTNKAYALIGEGDFKDSYGTITIGRLEDIDEQSAGQWTFDLEGGRLEVDAIRPEIRGISSVRVQNAGELSDYYTGDLVLRSGRNHRISTVTDTEGRTVIYLSAIDGAGLNHACSCPETSQSSRPPVTSINYQRPSSDGNVDLFTGACIEIESVEGGLKLSNPCSQPCCGCQELAVVKAAMQQVVQERLTLAQFVTRLTATATAMNQMLGLKLGDRGCGCDDE